LFAEVILIVLLQFPVPEIISTIDCNARFNYFRKFISMLIFNFYIAFNFFITAWARVSGC